MKTKIYKKPISEIFPLLGNCILDDGFSLDRDKAQPVENIELDGNEYSLFDEYSTESLWD